MSNYLTELKQRSEAEFLEFRQRIKESIRNKTQNGNDLLSPTSEEDPVPRKRQKLHEFGCFFGPSQPGIASRVLQESKPLLKDELLAAKALDSIQINKSTPSPTSGSEANELKRKAKQLKESRDYSFLFSDDAELHVSIKEPPSSLAPNSRSSSRGSLSSRPGSINSQRLSKLHPQRPSPARKSVPMDHRKKLTRKSRSSSEPLTSVRKEQRVEQRKVSNQIKRSSQVVVPRQQPLPPLKHHRMISKPPLKKAHQLKKKKVSSEEDEEALRMIREMCKTERFAGRDLDDYDDRCMEASLEDIIKEEKRSEKLAKKEDAEQLRLIEEDEKRERLMRKEKRQKLNH